MDKINKEVNETFRQLFADLSKSYSDLSKKTSQCYAIGKKEAYEEVLNWLLVNTNGDLKYISSDYFQSMMTEKMIKAKISLNQQEDDEELKPVFETKVYEQKKRLHRQSIQEPRDDNNVFNAFPMNMQTVFQQIQQNQYTTNNNNNNNHNGDSSDDSMNSTYLQKKRK